MTGGFRCRRCGACCTYPKIIDGVTKIVDCKHLVRLGYGDKTLCGVWDSRKDGLIIDAEAFYMCVKDEEFKNCVIKHPSLKA